LDTTDNIPVGAEVWKAAFDATEHLQQVFAILGPSSLVRLKTFDLNVEGLFFGDLFGCAVEETSQIFFSHSFLGYGAGSV
jgi:hypothetical protein